MKKYNTVNDMIKQLEFCEYQTKDGFHSLTTNQAFIELVELARQYEDLAEKLEYEDINRQIQNVDITKLIDQETAFKALGWE